jgi:hypothetical protein
LINGSWGKAKEKMFSPYNPLYKKENDDEMTYSYAEHHQIMLNV